MTRQEKQEAEAAIYGLGKPNMSQPTFTPEQLEQMREILRQHDASTGAGNKPGVIREFDLNAPERSKDWVPYRHQRYPLHLHNHAERKLRVVHNAKEEKAALAEGYEEEPYSTEEIPDAPEERADAAEIERLDKLARAPKGTKA